MCRLLLKPRAQAVNLYLYGFMRVFVWCVCIENGAERTSESKKIGGCQPYSIDLPALSNDPFPGWDFFRDFLWCLGLVIGCIIQSFVQLLPSK